MHMEIILYFFCGITADVGKYQFAGCAICTRLTVFNAELNIFLNILMNNAFYFTCD